MIGLPGEEDWPRDVALPRQAFHSKSPQPIENFVTDIDEQGKDLLLVSSGDAELTCTVLTRHSPCPCWVVGTASRATASHGTGHGLSAALISTPVTAGVSDSGVSPVPIGRESDTHTF